MNREEISHFWWSLEVVNMHFMLPRVPRDLTRLLRTLLGLTEQDMENIPIWREVFVQSNSVEGLGRILEKATLNTRKLTSWG